MQLAFPNKSKEKESFKLTWEAYEEVMGQDCTTPCEQCNPNTFTCSNPELQSQLGTYGFCDVCGMHGEDIKTARCGTCQQEGRETVVCVSCMPQEQLQWLRIDENKHHWRCHLCRFAEIELATATTAITIPSIVSEVPCCSALFLNLYAEHV